MADLSPRQELDLRRRLQGDVTAKEELQIRRILKSRKVPDGPDVMDALTGTARGITRGAIEAAPPAAGAFAGAGVGALGGLALAGPLGALIGGVGGGILGGVAGAPAGETLGRRAGQIGIGFEDIEQFPQGVRPFAKAGRAVGASLPFAAAPMAAARAGVQGGPFNPVIEAARRSPGQFASAELAAGTGAGIGAGAAEALFPGDEGISMAAEIAGGFASPSAILARSSKGIIGAVRRVLDTQTKAGRERQAAQQLNELVTAFGEDPEELAKILRRREVVDAPLTAGQKTASPSLIALERKLIGESAKLGREVRQDTQQSIQAVNKALRLATKSGDPELFRLAGEQRKQYFNSLIEARIKAAERSAAEAVEKIRPDSPKAREQANLKARDLLANALSDARTSERELWGRVDKTIDVTPDGTLDAYTNVRSELLEEETLPAPIEAFIRRFTKTEKGARVIKEDVTAGDLLRFRSRLLALGRKASAEGDPSLSRMLGAVADGVLDDLGAIGTPEADAARQFSFSLNDRFTRGPVARLLGTERSGGAQVAPELTLERSLAGGGPPAAVSARAQQEAVTPIEGMEPTSRFQEMKAAQEQFVRDMAENVIDAATGRVSTKRLAKFRRDNRGLLEQFPQLEQQTRDAQRAQSLAEKRLNILPRGRRIANQLAAFAKVSNVENPAVAFSQAMRSNTPSRDLTQLFRIAKRSDSSAVKRGARAAFFDAVFDQATEANGLISGDRLENLLTRFGQIARDEGIVSKKQMKNLSEVAQVSKRLEEAIKSADSIDEVIDEPPALFDLMVRLAGANIGATSALAKASGASIVTAGFTSQTFRKLFEKVPMTRMKDVLIEATRNPEVMARMLERPTTQAKAKRIERQINGFLLQAGIIQEDE